MSDETRTLFVPGRIELLGKHVDYAGGASLTCAVGVGIRAEYRPLAKPIVEVEDGATGRVVRVPLRSDANTGRAHGAAYVGAVSRRLARDFAPLRTGVHLRTTSDLPRSAGLSSSSAFVTLLTIALADVNRLRERGAWQRYLGTPLELAEYCGAVEMGGPYGPFAGERGVGTRGGAQDHTAILCNEAEQVGAFRYLPAALIGRARFPSTWGILVALSGVRATKTGGAREDYNRASDLVRSLLGAWNRATGRADHSLEAALRSSPDAPEALERVAAATHESPRHLARIAQFRAETERIVPGALAAFEARDAPLLGRLAVESQQRAETALGNQIPETMFLARAAMAAGAHAASAFGAGFGGAVWSIGDLARMDEIEEAWRLAYHAAFPQRQGKAQWLRLRPAAGVQWP